MESPNTGMKGIRSNYLFIKATRTIRLVSNIHRNQGCDHPIYQQKQ